MKSLQYLFVAVMALTLVSCYQDGNRDFAPIDGAMGRGGSMARFTSFGDFLYAVDHTSLKVFSLQNPTQPEFLTSITIEPGVETIYPFEGLLFIGSMNGMFIYSLDNPARPTFISSYSHITSCDPVVAKSNFAYVTLRSEAFCWGVNELHVLDISDIYNPSLVNTTFMNNPHGLGVGSHDLLFVTEGDHGLKIFNIANPRQPVLVHHIEGFHAYDVISFPQLLILTGNDGIRQFSYDADTLSLLSKIDIDRIND
jgi:hypothetical protein